MSDNPVITLHAPSTHVARLNLVLRDLRNLGLEPIVVAHESESEKKPAFPKLVEVKALCQECGASGIARGFADEDGLATPCVRCGGWGYTFLRYIPFETRRILSHVKNVRLPDQTVLTYEEFLERIMHEILSY